MIRYTKGVKNEASSFVDYYSVLGLQPFATDEELKKAFVRLAREQHPDMGGSNSEMQLINKAYATLKDTDKRRAYDLIHQFNTGTVESFYQPTGAQTTTGSLDGMSDEEIDNFVNSLFKEYSATDNKESFRRRIKHKIKKHRPNG